MSIPKNWCLFSDWSHKSLRRRIYLARSNRQLEEASTLPGCGASLHHWYLVHSWWVLVLGQAKEQSAEDAGMGMEREKEVYRNDLVQNFHFLAVSGPALLPLLKTCILNMQI